MGIRSVREKNIGKRSKQVVQSWSFGRRIFHWKKRGIKLLNPKHMSVCMILTPECGWKVRIISVIFYERVNHDPWDGVNGSLPVDPVLNNKSTKIWECPKIVIVAYII